MPTLTAATGRFGWGADGNFTFGNEFADGEGKGDKNTGNGGGARATIGLEDIAIEPKGARAKFFEVEGVTNGAPDEALDFLGASVNLALANVAEGLRVSVE